MLNGHLIKGDGIKFHSQKVAKDAIAVKGLAFYETQPVKTAPAQASRAMLQKGPQIQIDHDSSPIASFSRECQRHSFDPEFLPQRNKEGTLFGCDVRMRGRLLKGDGLKFGSAYAAKTSICSKGFGILWKKEPVVKSSSHLETEEKHEPVKSPELKEKASMPEPPDVQSRLESEIIDSLPDPPIVETNNQWCGKVQWY